MPKKRNRRENVARAAREKHKIRRTNRLPFILISILVGIASLALVAASFLNYAPPVAPTAGSPAVAPTTAPQSSQTLPIAFRAVPPVS